MLKIIPQLLVVPIFVAVWFFSAGAVGVELSFTNGTSLRLRGWWRE